MYYFLKYFTINRQDRNMSKFIQNRGSSFLKIGIKYRFKISASLSESSMLQVFRMYIGILLVLMIFYYQRKELYYWRKVFLTFISHLFFPGSPYNFLRLQISFYLYCSDIFRGSVIFLHLLSISLISFFEELFIFTMDLIPFQMEDILFLFASKYSL